MRKIHEALRLHFEHGRSKQEIARIINVSPSTVSDYVARAKLAGLGSKIGRANGLGCW
jgi:DNA-binding transcriptional regulator LsrR (DeoR family)